MMTRSSCVSLTELPAIQGDAEDSRKPNVTLNGQPADFKVDTGSDAIIAPTSLFDSLKLTPLLSKTTKLL